MQISDKEEREEALREICLQWAKRDPAAALAAAWRGQLGQSEDLAGAAALENLAESWAAADFPAALAWAAAQQPVEENDQRRDRVIKRLAASWSQTAPADAARLAVEQIPPGSVQCEAVMAVLDHWAERDLDGAMAWAKEFPQDGLRETAFRNLTRLTQERQPQTP